MLAAYRDLKKSQKKTKIRQMFTKNTHVWKKIKEIRGKRENRKRMWIPKSSLTIVAKLQRVIMSLATVLVAIYFLL